jgi:hypothetical protein
MTDAGKSGEKTGLQELMDRVAGAKGDPSSWPVTLFLLGLLVVILSVVGIKLALTKRKAAELARKLREQEEVAKASKEDEKLASNEEVRLEAEKVTQEAQQQVQGFKDELAARKVSHEEYVRELQSITSWDDVVVVDARSP